MLHVRFLATAEGLVVSIAKIKSMAQLILLEPGEGSLVNNRINLETWNTIYDSINKLYSVETFGSSYCWGSDA